MRTHLIALTCPALYCLATLASTCFAQTDAAADRRVAALPSTSTAPAPASDQAAAQPRKFHFILFWNENTPQVRQISDLLNAAAAKQPGRFDWSAVNVRDPLQQALVEQYQVSRAPMPLVLCVAPNGAVTGAYVRQFNDVALERSLVTPLMADATKALQDKKIVLLHVKAADGAPLPPGAVEFADDSDFRDRIVVLDLLVADPVEKRFLSDMKLNPTEIRDSLVVIMAPPGMLVGKFPASVTKDQITTQLHAAGKCCNDPNCKHNKGAQ